MKKLLLTIITLSIITFTGCYDPDTATVRINLGNIPVAHNEPKSLIDKILGIFEKDAYAAPLSSYTLQAQVTAVHIAAYSGNSLMASMSIDADDIDAGMNQYQQIESVIEFNVPAGENIDIIVIGENMYTAEGQTGAVIVRSITYFGQNTDVINLKAGETTTVPINMSTTYFSSFGFNIDQSALPYSITWQKIPGAIVVITDQYEGEIYRGTGTQAYYTSANAMLTWHAEFPFVNLTSAEIPAYAVK